MADRDTSRAAAHKTVAQRRAVLLEAELARQFPDGDPLADDLRAALTTAGQGSGDTVASVLASRAALPLPILMVRGLNAAAAPSRSGRRGDKVRQNLSAIQNREFAREARSHKGAIIGVQSRRSGMWTHPLPVTQCSFH